MAQDDALSDSIAMRGVAAHVLVIAGTYVTKDGYRFQSKSSKHPLAPNRGIAASGDVFLVELFLRGLEFVFDWNGEWLVQSVDVREIERATCCQEDWPISPVIESDRA